MVKSPIDFPGASDTCVIHCHLLLEQISLRFGHDRIMDNLEELGVLPRKIENQV